MYSNSFNSIHQVSSINYCYTEAAASLPEYHTIADFEHFSTALCTQSWSDMCSINLDEAYQTFKARLSEALTESSRKRRLCHKKSIYMDCIVYRALQLSKKKKSLWATYRLTLDPINRASFTHCRNELWKHTRTLRMEYESKLAGSLKQNPKPFWR